MEDKEKIRASDLCSGNICRSPMAEAVFQQMVKEKGLEDHFEIESAATTHWEVGSRPHPGTRKVLEKYGVPLDPEKRAWQVRPGDIDRYDYIIGMDSEHVETFQRWGMEIPRLMDFALDGGPRDIPDPYYEGNFELVYKMVRRGLEGLLDRIIKREGLNGRS